MAMANLLPTFVEKDIFMPHGSKAKSDEEGFSRSRSTSVGSLVEPLGFNGESETGDEVMQQTPSNFMAAPRQAEGLSEFELAFPSPFMFSGVSQSIGGGLTSFTDEPEKDPEVAAGFFSTRVRLPSRPMAAAGFTCKPVRKGHLKGCGSVCVCSLGAPGEKKRQQQKLKIGAKFGDVNTMQPLMYSGSPVEPSRQF